MDFSATQIYDDEDFPSTQRISWAPEEEQSMQVGTLTIDSIDHQIKKGLIRIGRLSSCDIVISDQSVSKVHAEIEAAGGSTWICDLDSSNKTKLNNLILRPKRSYELKDGSVIEFGKVRAIYHTYQAEDTMIPETPAPRKKAPNTIIPNTPDSSINTSSGTDGSIIFGTQRDEENSVFRKPLLPQHQSTNIGKKNLSCGSSLSDNESDNASSLALLVSESDTSENRDNSIFDVETQNFEEMRKKSISIHDIETQRFSTDDFPKSNVDASKKSVRPPVEDKIIEGRATDICDLETQKYSTNNISEVGTQVVAETQAYVGNTDNNVISKNKNCDKNSHQVECDISDLEMQNFGNNATNISDMETQIAWTSTKNVNCDTETPLESDGTAKETSSDRANEDKDKDKTEDAVNSASSRDKVTRSASRSCSPASLNLSSPGIDEDRISSRLNQSGDLLESTELLEFFNEGIENQVEAQTSTPKPKTSSEKNNNVESALNASDIEDHSDDDNIFEAPTQLIKTEALSNNNSKNEIDDSKKKRGKPRSEQTADDSDETDAEEELEKLSRNSKNDPSTSVESVDVYDLLTQKVNDGIKNTETLSSEVPDKLANLKDLSSKNNQNDVDDATSMQIINSNVDQIDDRRTPKNLDCENEEYEMALTQEISEVEEQKNCEREKTDKSAEVNLNDTLERNLNEMFDNAISDSINEPQMMSTQILADILESSCDNDLSADKFKLGNEAPIQNASQKNSRELRDRSSRNLPSIKAKTDSVNNEHNDSQDSDIYFSNITTKRKRNIIRDTQEFEAPVKSITSSQVSKVNDDKTEKSKSQEEKHDSQKNKNDATVEPLTDNDTNKSKNGERNLRKLSLTRQRGAVTSEENKKALEKNSGKAEVDNADKCSPSDFNVRTSCLSENGQRVRALNELNESDDDILTRLPAVRISGTLSNPPSSSASSTSTVCSSQATKRAAAKSRTKKSNANKSVTRKMRQRAEDSEEDEKNRANDKSPVLLNDHPSSSSDSESSYKRFKQMADRMLSTLKRKRNVRVKKTEKKDTCSSPSASKNLEQKTESESGSLSLNSSRATRRTSKRNDQNSCVLQEDVESAANKPVKSKSIAANRKRILNEKEEDLEQTESKKHKADKAENYSVLTRRTSKPIADEQSPNIITKTNSQKPTSVIASNKSPKTIKAASIVLEDSEKAVSSSKSDESVDSGKPNVRKTRSKFPSIVIKTNTKLENLSAIENTNSSKSNKMRKASSRNSQNVSSSSEISENVDFKKANVKQSRRKVKGSHVAIHYVTENEESNTSKQVQTKEEETVIKQQDKILKIELTPIRPTLVGRESQEVEVIMNRGQSNVQDEHLLIREQSSAKIFSKALRTRNRKQFNTDSEVTSLSESSGVSSDIDSDKVQSDTSAPKAKRGRMTRNSVSSQSAVQIPIKEETFKRPTRVNKKSTNSVLDSSSESSIVGDYQDGSESDVSSSSRLSRSKTVGAKRKIEVKQNTLKATNVRTSSRLNTSMEVSSVPSTPSRMRRSASVLSNSSPSSAKHRILFTGIAEDNSKLVKTLGGTKVEEPAKCTVLVTDKVRRTYKFLCALAMGIPIVAIDWLRDSEPAARFLDWENYILKDPAAEAKFSFRLRKSLDKAKEKKLLDGYTVVVTPNVAPPPIEELKNMVASCGGKVLLRPPTKWSEKAVVISREEDLPNARKFIAKAPKTVTVQSTEFILTGILRQEVDFDKYKLL